MVTKVTTAVTMVTMPMVTTITVTTYTLYPSRVSSLAVSHVSALFATASALSAVCSAVIKCIAPGTPVGLSSYMTRRVPLQCSGLVLILYSYRTAAPFKQHPRSTPSSPPLMSILRPSFHMPFKMLKKTQTYTIYN